MAERRWGTLGHDGDNHVCLCGAVYGLLARGDESERCMPHQLPSSYKAQQKWATPDGVWYGKDTSLGDLRAWGCRAVVHIKGLKRAKFQPKAALSIMLGCDGHNPRCYHVLIESTGQVETTSHVTFDESVMPARTPGHPCASEGQVVTWRPKDMNTTEGEGLDEGLASRDRSATQLGGAASGAGLVGASLDVPGLLSLAAPSQWGRDPGR